MAGVLPEMIRLYMKPMPIPMQSAAAQGFALCSLLFVLFNDSLGFQVGGHCDIIAFYMGNQPFAYGIDYDIYQLFFRPFFLKSMDLIMDRCFEFIVTLFMERIVRVTIFYL